MNCAYHPEVASATRCSTCNKDLCESCSHQIKEKIYCQDCLIQGAEWSAKLRRARVDVDSPARAALLSVIPALGAIYNGQYLKAVTHFAVFAALCIMSSDVHGVFGWAAATFYFYMFFDSYRSAQQLRQERMAGPANAATGRLDDEKSPFWGILLIVLGVIFTLNNLGVIDFFFIRRSWPLIFIVVGGFLVYRAITKKADRTSAASTSGF